LTLTETLATKPRQAVALVSAQGVEAYLPLAGLVDLEQERARLHKALAEAERQIQHAEKMLTNENIRCQVVAGDRFQRGCVAATRFPPTCMHNLLLNAPDQPRLTSP